MRSFVLAWASALAFTAGCGSGPAETWEDALTHVQHEERSTYCDAFLVIERKCLRCHQEPPKNGAPFALDTYAATQLPSPSMREPERIRADRMLKAVESGFMPYTALVLDPPVEPLTCEERTTLLAWLRAGSPAPADGEADCADSGARLLECAEGAAGAGGE